MMFRLAAALFAGLVFACAAPVSAKAAKASIEAKVSTETKSSASKGDKAATGKSSSSTADSDAELREELRKADSTSKDSLAQKALVLTIDGEIAERGSAVVLFGEERKSLKNYLDTMRRARDDSSIKHIIIKLSSSELGLAHAQELRHGIGELREKGKKTTALLEDDSQPSYLVASACEQVVLPSSGNIILYGVKADAYFFRRLLDKVGANAEIVHIGKYKSYGETFTEEDFTSPARENMTEIVDDIYAQLIKQVAESRKLAPGKVEEIINRGPLTADEAKEAGLIDRVAYGSEIYKELEKQKVDVVEAEDYTKDSSSSSADVNIFSFFSLLGKQQAEKSTSSKYPKVAVVYAVGPIVPGSADDMGFSSDTQIAADDFIETLDEVQKDRDIKGVILRIDSPGGSAFASDLIWKKVVELREEKPVIVSMGNVAASGGYYIAMGATKIIAQPGTLTGSIGVVGGKLNMGGGYDKIGVRKTTISKGPYANLFSETAAFSEAERTMVEKMMRDTYDEFVTKAAEGRKMPKEKMEQVAEGKVYVGARAKEAGLVDGLGGLAQAVKEVKSALGMKKDDKVSLVAYPQELTILDVLQKAMGGNATANIAAPGLDSFAPQQLRPVLRHARVLLNLFARERVLTVMPFLPSVE